MMLICGYKRNMSLTFPISEVDIKIIWNENFPHSGVGDERIAYVHVDSHQQI
jgi:hypothetical protein